MKKVIRNGKVAVLFSPGFGAGWSTWNDDKEWLLYHTEIVAAVESGDNKKAGEIAERIGKELNGDKDYTCVLGAKDLKIAWIPEDEAFEIVEYDGYESCKIESQIQYEIT
jgi:hypothetical protein